MPTPRGWVVGVVGTVLAAAGLLYGAEQLTQLGAAVLALLLLALAVVRMGRHELTVSREVSPSRVPAARSVEVTLTLRNEGRGPAPLLLIEDGLPRGLHGRTRFAVNGIEAQGHREVSYELTPTRRGRYEIGPVSIAVVDPFNLARVRSEQARRSTLVVYPVIERLVLPRELGEKRSVTAAALRNPTGARGEDFYTLREYELGDDLRKVHWPSTAKRGRFMIRQEETPWHTRATILLDDRRSAFGGPGGAAAFERAIEGAASFVSLYHSAGYGFRLAGVLERGPGSGKGAAHYNACLDTLALVTAGGDGEAATLAARLTEIESGRTAEDSLILVTGEVAPEVAPALARCRRRFRNVVVVAFPPHRFGGASTKARWAGEGHLASTLDGLRRSGVQALLVGPGDSLAGVWGTGAGKRGGDGAWRRRPELV